MTIFSPDKVIVACIQTSSTPLMKENLRRLDPMIKEARSKGATLITLPENVAYMGSNRETLFANAFHEDQHPAIQFFSKIAKDVGAWILAGSLAVKTDHERLANRSYLFNDQGEIVARYDKIHMFDAVLSERESYKESANYRGGNKAVVADTPWGKAGLTICYDLRFPHLHRTLAKAGAKIIMIPAAFAYTTGVLHWHVLVRARAIETGCFVIAPAQCGTHDTQRRSYGHSLVVAPNGEILSEGADEPGVFLAELDLTQVDEQRKRLPSLQHDCTFEQSC